MEISQEMWNRAQSLIASDSREAERKANVLPNGRRRVKPVSYSIPQRAQDLVTALGKGDPEPVASIMMYRYASGANEPS